MLEITIRRLGGVHGPVTFQFENDALQAFVAEQAGLGFTCDVIGLTALGVPLAQPAALPKTAVESLGRGSIRPPLQAQAKVNEPIHKAGSDADKAKALADARRAEAEAKARAEKK